MKSGGIWLLFPHDLIGISVELDKLRISRRIDATIESGLPPNSGLVKCRSAIFAASGLPAKDSRKGRFRCSCRHTARCEWLRLRQETYS